MRAEGERFDGNRRLRLVYLGNFAEKDLFDLVVVSATQAPEGVEIHLVGDGRNKAHVPGRSRSGRPPWILPAGCRNLRWEFRRYDIASQ